jgi:L-ascorbate metabolism protein UlaG (beta-lactamase superfamily)
MVFVITLAIYADMPKFGSLPSGKRLERIEKSPNYKNGEFQNVRPFVVIKPRNLFESLINFLFAKKQNKCEQQIPSIKTDLINLNKAEEVLVWFGHSSYFLQIDENRILVDPVFSEVSSPVPFFPKAFPGANIYQPKDLPEIDFLVITHDHWDHLDYETVRRLKFKTVICPLGVGAHLERFGVDSKNITEMDWDESIAINEFKIHCLTARHWSRRKYKKNKTLWASFLVETPSSFKIFIGGDGGYGSHFLDIGKKFKNIDLAILENGQYNKNWKQIHMHPQETVKAAEDLRANTLLPVHMAKLALSTHFWNEPLEEITELSKERKFRLITPMIGQKVILKNNNQKFSKWWVFATK